MHRARKFEKFAPLHVHQISFGFCILLPLFSTKKLKLVSEKCSAHASLKKLHVCNSLSDPFRILYNITPLPDQITQAGEWEMHRTRKFEKFARPHLSQISFGFYIFVPLSPNKNLKLVSEKCTAHASLKNLRLCISTRSLSDFLYCYNSSRPKNPSW